MQLACMNNKRCVAYGNYTQFTSNWGACKARLNIYTDVSHMNFACILRVNPPYCSHFTRV